MIRQWKALLAVARTTAPDELNAKEIVVTMIVAGVLLTLLYWITPA